MSPIRTVIETVGKGILSTGAAISRITAPLHPAIAKISSVAWAILTSKWFLALSGIALCLFALDWYLSDDSTPAPGDTTPLPTNTSRPPTHDTSRYPFVSGNVPAPPTRITAGCDNIANSCWFNGSMNSLAGTPLFDSLLNLDLENIGNTEAARNLKEVVPFLKIVINELRNNRPIRLDLAKVVVGQVGKVKYVQSGIGGSGTQVNINEQHDSSEFLISLISDWKIVAAASNGTIPSPPSPTIISLFKPIGLNGIPKDTVMKNDESIVFARPRVDDFNNPTRPLNLSRLLKTRDPITDEDGFSYIKKDYLDLSAPSLIVNINRVYYPRDGTSTRRCNNTVQIDLDATGTRPVVTLSANKTTQEYYVKGAMIHKGSASGGHWTYLEVNADGKFYMHNDSNVHEVSRGIHKTPLEAGMTLLSTGTIFFLEKVVSPTV